MVPIDTKAILARVNADLDVAKTQLHAAQKKVTRLETMRDGLELAVEEYETASTQDRSAAEETEEESSSLAEANDETPVQGLPGISQAVPQEEVSQVDLAFAGLAALDRPASTGEILDRVGVAGYVRSREQMRGALTWLLKTGRVERVAPGTWALAKKDFRDDLSTADTRPRLATVPES